MSIQEAHTIKERESMIINKVYAKLVPPLSKEEYTQLKISIKDNGLYIPITINDSDVILDGHHRYKACNELGIKTETLVKKFENSYDEAIYVGECNLQRRQLTPLQRIVIVRNLKPYYKSRAKENLSKAGKGLHISAKVDTREELAKKANVSHFTWDRGETILDTKNEDIIDPVLSGSKAITTAYNLVKAETRPIPKTPLPTGQYDVILADPSWEFIMTNPRGGAQRHYSTMTDDKISKMKIPSASNCIIFLWVPNTMIFHAGKVLEAWGFEYKTHFVWTKDKIGLGSWLRNQHELLFIGIKGKVNTPAPSVRYSSIINSPREKHSKKPDVVYEMIEKMYPNGKYLELFARQKRTNWTSWGDEV